MIEHNLEYSKYLWKRSYGNGKYETYVTKKYAEKISSICNNEKRTNELLGLIAMFPLLRDEELFAMSMDNIFVLDDIAGFDIDRPDDYSHLRFLEALYIEEADNGNSVIDVLSDKNKDVKNTLENINKALSPIEFDEPDLSVIQKILRLRQIVTFGDSTHCELYKKTVNELFKGICDSVDVVVYQGLEPLQVNAIVKNGD